MWPRLLVTPGSKYRDGLWLLHLAEARQKVKGWPVASAPGRGQAVSIGMACGMYTG